MTAVRDSPGAARLRADETLRRTGTTVMDIVVGESLMSKDELDEAEAVVRAGSETYVTVGRALMAIRDGKGYRLRGYNTFEAYLDGVWDMRRRQGYRLISAAQVVLDGNFVSARTQNDALPTVTQARILASLPIEERAPLIEQGVLELPTRDLSTVVRAGRAELTERRDREKPQHRLPAPTAVVGSGARPARATLLVGDVRAALAGLPRDSVHVAISSPPYYGLRSYGSPDLVWGGDADHEHEWGVAVPLVITGGFHRMPPNQTGGTKDYSTRGDSRGRFCLCGAWLGSLGLEPSPDCLAWARSEPPCSQCYVCHIRTVLAALWPVLREDGTFWLNLGDSYSGSGKGPTGWSGTGDQIRRQGNLADKSRSNRGSMKYNPLGGVSPAGIRRKNLLLMPERVALAAQADGWIVRSRIPWLKRNSMPESTTDRPSSAVEYVLVLARSERYFWDADAVRVGYPAASLERASYRLQDIRSGSAVREGMEYGPKGKDAVTREYPPLNPAGRNRRNSDWFFESWQGLLLDDDGDPEALVVNPAPFPGAHFATFSSKLVEPMIRASTSEHGVCPECGAPWTRCVERTAMVVREGPGRAGLKAAANGSSSSRTALTGTMLEPARSETTGWRPSCTHGWHADATHEGGGLTPVPATVLDPFAGAGSTLLAAARLSRDSIGIELSRPYADMARDRIQADGGFTVDVELREVPG